MSTPGPTSRGGSEGSGGGTTPPLGGPPLNLAGVKLSLAGRTFACDAGPLSLRKGDQVVIEDDRGLELATVVVPTALRAAPPPLPRVLRLADTRDLARAEANERRAAETLIFARERARARAMPIKLFRSELHHGGTRATFYFSADNRVDFRDLVRDLAAKHHLRVEMRQVGVRDEAKMVGGIGSCGRELCCTTFLPKFAPVSIKNAKHQGLVLNPAKVSGQCGRLKCCLVYEEANYVEAARNLPRAGKRVSTPDGVGRVGDVDVLAGRLRVYFDDGPPRVFTAGEVQLLAAPAGQPGQEPGRPPGPEPGHDSDPGPDHDDPPDGVPSD